MHAYRVAIAALGMSVVVSGKFEAILRGMSLPK